MHALSSTGRQSFRSASQRKEIIKMSMSVPRAERLQLLFSSQWPRFETTALNTKFRTSYRRRFLFLLLLEMVGMQSRRSLDTGCVTSYSCRTCLASSFACSRSSTTMMLVCPAPSSSHTSPSCRHVLKKHKSQGQYLISPFGLMTRSDLCVQRSRAVRKCWRS